MRNKEEKGKEKCEKKRREVRMGEERWRNRCRRRRRNMRRS